MDDAAFPGASRINHEDMSRRTAVSRFVIGGVGAALLARNHDVVQAQEATPGTAECVATAPAMDESGIAFVPLLVGGIVRDMPPGPIEVRISGLVMAPGTVIETGTTACPGGPGRIVYAPDGRVVEEAATEGVQYTPAGSTQYIPAGIPDGAGNEGSELMSSIIIEFVPVEQSVTPTT